MVAEGLRFPEGPIWMRDGSILLVEIHGQCLTRISPAGERSVVAQLGGGPNGAAIGPDGAVYVCNNGGMVFVTLPDGTSVPHGVPDFYSGGSIQRVDLATGQVRTLYASCDGLTLRGPNDIVFDAHGGFWFTDLGKVYEHSRDDGAFFYAQADGGGIICARRGMTSPNGIGLSPLGDEVYVAETVTSRVWRHGIVAPGRIAEAGGLWAPGAVLGPLPGYQMLDSLAVEAGGSVCVATLVNGGITVFHLDGSTEHVGVPDRLTTNLCFGGGDMCDVWITASGTGRLYKGRWPRPGLRLNYYA